MNKGLFAIPLFLLAAVAFTRAQSGPSFEVYADADQVLVDNFFEVTFTLRNGDGQGFEPPRLQNDFVILAGPSRSMSTTIINGQVSKELSFTYTLQPRRAGRLTIGKARIQVAGQTLTTPEIVVEALETSAAGGKADRQFFVKTILSAEEAYIGQQVRLDYRLYTTVEIQNYNITEESDYSGFYASDIRRPDTRVKREIIDGVQYFTRTLKSMALYPQQAGQLTVEPAIMQLGVVTNANRSPSSLFFGNDIRRVPTRTEPATLRVFSLPDGAPASFSGAVGQFSMQSGVNRTTVTTDDALEITMVIEGNGDVKRVQPPVLNLPEGFEVYEPKVEETYIGEGPKGRLDRKVFEYLILPRVPGTYELQPEFSYFDPDSNVYVTLADAVFSIAVRPGAVSEDLPVIAEAGEEDLQDIRFIKLNTRLEKKDGYLTDEPVFWIVSGFPALLFLGGLFWRRRKAMLLQVDPEELRRTRARKVALERLKQAESHLRQQAAREFYDEISKAMLGYVSNKLGIPLSEMSKDNVREKLISLQVEPDAIDKFMDILQNSEMALFAGKDNHTAMEGTYRHSLEVLAGIEQRLS